MEQIKIYSSKKKSFWLLIGSLIFVLIGIYSFIEAENLVFYRARNPIFIKVVGVACILFFGIGIYVSIAQLLKNRLILIVDQFGLNVNPKKSLTERIEWKNIIGFSQIKINSSKSVIIEVDNPDYWFKRENDLIQKKLIEFNISNFGSPFNLSANSMQINYKELIKILNQNLVKYKN